MEEGRSPEIPVALTNSTAFDGSPPPCTQGDAVEVGDSCTIEGDERQAKKNKGCDSEVSEKHSH